MATILEESGFNPEKDLKIVGTNPVKHDGLDKVTGRANFGADFFLPGMLYGKILRSPHAQGRGAARRKGSDDEQGFAGDSAGNTRRRYDPQCDGARKSAV